MLFDELRMSVFNCMQGDLCLKTWAAVGWSPMATGCVCRYLQGLCLGVVEVG